MTDILALDLGTQCGWARTRPRRLLSGVWSLSPDGDGHAGRIAKFQRALIAVTPRPVLIVYEEAMSHKGTRAAHIFGHLEGKLLEYAVWAGIPVEALTPSQVKKHATGKGNADKEMMVAAANEKWRMEILVSHHDQADALWTLDTWLAGVRMKGSKR